MKQMKKIFALALLIGFSLSISHAFSPPEKSEVKTELGKKSVVEIAVVENTAAFEIVAPTPLVPEYFTADENVKAESRLYSPVANAPPGNGRSIKESKKSNRIRDADCLGA
jgi:hypothetical protein